MQDLKRFRVEVAAVVEADKEKAEALTALMQQLNAARVSESGLKKELDAATQAVQVCAPKAMLPSCVKACKSWIEESGARTVW